MLMFGPVGREVLGFAYWVGPHAGAAERVTLTRSARTSRYRWSWSLIILSCPQRHYRKCDLYRSIRSNRRRPQLRIFVHPNP